MKKDKASRDWWAGYKAGLKDGIHQMMVITISVMRDKWGFGPTRLQRFNRQLEDKSEAVSLGFVTIKELEKTLRAEGGIYFER